jgi:hypothetical protein
LIFEPQFLIHGRGVDRRSAPRCFDDDVAQGAAVPEPAGTELAIVAAALAVMSRYTSHVWEDEAMGDRIQPAAQARSQWLRFSLRFLLLVILLAASYCAGWVSHRSWNQRNTEQTISEAVRRIGGPVEVETVDDSDGLIFRGRKEDVDELTKTVREIEAVSRQ